MLFQFFSSVDLINISKFNRPLRNIYCFLIFFADTYRSKISGKKLYFKIIYFFGADKCAMISLSLMRFLFCCPYFFLLYISHKNSHHPFIQYFIYVALKNVRPQKNKSKRRSLLSFLMLIFGKEEEDRE